MPISTIIMLIAVVAVFAVFAITLSWAQLYVRDAKYMRAPSAKRDEPTHNSV
jgi:hypothetical protein